MRVDEVTVATSAQIPGGVIEQGRASRAAGSVSAFTGPPPAGLVPAVVVVAAVVEGGEVELLRAVVSASVTSWR